MQQNHFTSVRERILTTWYRRRLKEEIAPLIAKWEGMIGVKVAAWGVKQMKTKWGTCNIEAHRIWLNLELIKKPVHCLEYIIVHEMMHLLERHHNERFTAYMNRFMPLWRIAGGEKSHFPVQLRQPLHSSQGSVLTSSTFKEVKAVGKATCLSTLKM